MRSMMLALLLVAAPALAAEDVPVLKEGANCAKSKPPVKEGETHRCVFDTTVHLKWDFSTRNGRAQYLFSKLGPDCDVMEILADEEFVQVPAPAVPLRRVSVLCEG